MISIQKERNLTQQMPFIVKAANMTEEPNLDQRDALVSLNFKITERERQPFKVWCAEHRISQVDRFRKGVELLRTQTGAPK